MLNLVCELFYYVDSLLVGLLTRMLFNSIYLIKILCMSSTVCEVSFNAS